MRNKFRTGLAALLMGLVVVGVLCAAGNDLADTAKAIEVPLSKDAVPVAGRPLTAVVVTQCNQLIVAYLTMPDGTLLRFDQTSGISADKLQQMAYTAPHSERVEAVCDEDTVPGVKGYESHGGPTT